MNNTKIFCLTDDHGNLLPPAVQAAVLAKYSRSPLSAREILKKVTEEKADTFHDKWTIEFGHKSVAELAVIPVCFEGVSIIASKFIESWQRPGYAEKSTRYQEFSRESFVMPPNAPLGLKTFSDQLYDAYQTLYPKVLERCAKEMGKSPKKKEVKGRAFDNVRYLLPAGTGTNLAMVGNARDIRDVIKALRSHHNDELRGYGDLVYEAMRPITPTLMRHADPTEFVSPIQSLGDFAYSQSRSGSWYVKIHKPYLMSDPKLEQKSFEADVADMYGKSWTEFCNFMNTRPEHEEVPDIFKTINITFDIMMDYGAFRDLQRHRRCEQFIEPLSTSFGYVVPADIEGTDLEPEYRRTMELIDSAPELEPCDVDTLQYATPLGYLHRSRFKMDLKELYYVIELRSKPQGHISYRKIVYEMHKLAVSRWPELMQWCRVHPPTAIGEHS